MSTKQMDKNKKYDRQLRLWGDHGQQSLETATVCLVNATATGTEILKNLILPGVGSFTIVDGNKVTGQDIGNNFFLDKDSLGKSRAQVATELLLELNEDVSGDFVDEKPEVLVENNPTFFNTFSIVIVTDISEKGLLTLADLLWKNGVPLLITRSYGLIGYMRLAVKEHTVTESHPDSSHEDLRLDHPFPALVDFCDSLNLDEMSKKDHMHTPWLVIIYKYLQIWKERHNGDPPKNYKEKKEFKELIKTGIRSKDEDIPEDEENFDEAITHVNSVLVPTKVPDSVCEIFNDNACCNLHTESSAFWIMARAVKDFVDHEGDGMLPLRGSIPDMTADSERYIKLQNVYKDKANSDMSLVYARVVNLLKANGKPHDFIEEEDVRLFCKNSYFLRLIRGRSIEEEHTPDPNSLSHIASLLDDPSSEDITWYILLRAVDRFHAQYNRYPGQYDDQVEADIAKLKGCVGKMTQEWGLTSNIKDDMIHEICRYGAAELHSVASFMGGIAAQEAIKIVTSQFVPFNNTYIYNAMKQTSMTEQL
ncbi:unnamed protein product [Owenia fusiformis]|uniref:NEDD8-activating enzyme E1 regulatory subunit n=1 Tax=Owenia fusiformis TaxID=6347 RepID=A0A8J1TVD9_OWEFU|nr:unnamed protein product [Owenia fusiformis]